MFKKCFSTSEVNNSLINKRIIIAKPEITTNKIARSFSLFNISWRNCLAIFSIFGHSLGKIICFTSYYY